MTSPPAPAVRRRVLLAEADAGDAELVQIWLRRAQVNQYEIWHVESLGDAEGCLAKSDFDLILLDLLLPDAPGPFAFHALHERRPELPIIVFSTFADAEAAARLVSEGAYDHLVKGQMSGDTLIRSMRHAVAHGELARELAGMRDQWSDASHQRAEWAAGLAQECRTPLHTVLGMADLLLETELTREQEGYVRSFLRASETLLDRLESRLADGELVGSEAELAPLARETGEGDRIAPAAALRVLVVDDSEAARAHTVSLLGSVGHVAEPVADGESALELFREGDYDLVLLDLQMPGLDGYETARRLRVLEEELGREPVPVLAVSAERDRRACLDAGCDAHVPKPLARESLLEALARHGPKHQQRMLRVDGQTAQEVDHYLHERHNDLAGLRMALANDDFDSVQAVGHLLEGSAGRHGFQELAAIGCGLQRAAGEGDRAAVERGAAQLTEFLREVKIVVR